MNRALFRAHPVVHSLLASVPLTLAIGTFLALKVPEPVTRDVVTRYALPVLFLCTVLVSLLPATYFFALSRRAEEFEMALPVTGAELIWTRVAAMLFVATVLIASATLLFSVWRSLAVVAPLGVSMAVTTLALVLLSHAVAPAYAAPPRLLGGVINYVSCLLLLVAPFVTSPRYWIAMLAVAFVAALRLRAKLPRSIALAPSSRPRSPGRSVAAPRRVLARWLARYVVRKSLLGVIYSPLAAFALASTWMSPAGALLVVVVVPFVHGAGLRYAQELLSGLGPLPVSRETLYRAAILPGLVYLAAALPALLVPLSSDRSHEVGAACFLAVIAALVAHRWVLRRTFAFTRRLPIGCFLALVAWIGAYFFGEWMLERLGWAYLAFAALLPPAGWWALSAVAAIFVYRDGLRRFRVMEIDFRGAT